MKDKPCSLQIEMLRSTVQARKMAKGRPGYVAIVGVRLQFRYQRTLIFTRVADVMEYLTKIEGATTDKDCPHCCMHPGTPDEVYRLLRDQFRSPARALP